MEKAGRCLDSLLIPATPDLLTTIHAQTPAARALRRFANLVLRSHAQGTFEDIEAEIGEAIDYVVHVEREPGRRVIREVLRLDDYDRRSQQFKFEIVSGPNSALNSQHNLTGKDTNHATA